MAFKAVCDADTIPIEPAHKSKFPGSGHKKTDQKPAVLSIKQC